MVVNKKNKDIVYALNLPVSTICTSYTRRESILKAAKVTICFASSKVVSLSQYPGMDKMESLPLEWTDGCTKHGVPLSYNLGEISLFNRLI